MLLRALRHCVVLFLFTFMGTVAMHGQAAAEYGMATANSAGMHVGPKAASAEFGNP